MEINLVEKVQKTFEEIKMIDETGFEFWSARDLQKALGYKKWERFKGVIEKAILNCESSGGIVRDNFLSEKEFFPELGKTSVGGRPRENFLLTRYACYLIALNGDARIFEISIAKTYFASQTRKLELAEEKIEFEKRLEARKKLKESEDKIEKTIYERGIKLPVEFATFKNKGIEALYNISVKKLKQKRNIPENRALADFDNEVELRAKDFIYAVTDHNIKKKQLKGKKVLENELIQNSKATRKTLLERDIIPEELEKQEDLKILEKKHKKISVKNTKKLK
ncbi:DNA damage-inducible protein D [Candidatus Gracilibacteria bacterium]|nr:MAG: DNA damage-inducible protein D [Candidatus Gracilibacteria bacterium]